jgi:soluble lytic murein transglycosylase-like protein
VGLGPIPGDEHAPGGWLYLGAVCTPESGGDGSGASRHGRNRALRSEESSGRFHRGLNVNWKLGLFFVGAALGAQPPADFETSVKASMAPSIARQRAAIQKQAVSTVRPVSPSAGVSFFTVPFPPVEAGVADCDPLPADQLDPLVEAAAQKTGVDAQLVRAVIDQESAGRPCALSARGAEGLMQLMPATAEEFDVEDPFDPKQNVEAGAKLLKSLLERYKNDPTLVLGAYNAGAARVDQEGGVPQIPETMDYVAKILNKLVSQKSNSESSVGTPAK